MTKKRELVLAALIVAGSVAVVAFRLGTGEDQAAEVAQGHDHSAMSAAAETRNPVVLDAEAAGRIGVAFATVEHRSLPVSVRAVGTVAYDETRLATVNPKVNGWVERLYVDFTGSPVSAGEPLLEVYSPQLVTAQEELILATRLLAEAGPGRATENAEQLLTSARRRLAYWDIPEDEIRRIEGLGEPTKTLTLRAPASGIVVEKNVVRGDQIMPGMTVYRIADLSRVWVEADVFEKDLALVSEGQTATVTFEAFPGRLFSGPVTYVYPTVSMQSRTARIRLELANPRLDLKPGMYADITLDVPDSDMTAVVPRSALIDTGERTIVFVRASSGALVPRDVTVGRASGRFAQILEGVEPGEQVVSSAAFLVDAESNLGTMTGTTGAESAEMPAGGSSHVGHE